MGLLFQIDSFTDLPFTGNPAAVCLLDQPAPSTWMQKMAAEMNLSETAFLWPEEEAFRLRWFTPTVEIRLCGHATLAAAHALWSQRTDLAGKPLQFETMSGTLRASQTEDGWIELDFPTDPVTPAPCPGVLLEALSLKPSDVLFSGKSPDSGFWLIEVASGAQVSALKPRYDLLVQEGSKACIVTAPPASPSPEQVDFVSRFFGPNIGIAEDPVTGAAHCCLAPHWAARLGRNVMLGHQISNRPGLVRVRLDGRRTHLGGRAITIFEGRVGASALPSTGR